MSDKELYDAIFRRKSVRRYDMTPLSQDKLNKLWAFIGTINRLDETIKTDFTILTEEKIRGLFSLKFMLAPHYICIYSEKKEGYLMNAGFIMQQIDLFLSSNNIGSCWLGMAKPGSDPELTKDGLSYVIMLAFGNSPEPIHRSGTAQFKRKNLNEISSINNAAELLEPVRLAPSAGNTQCWFFSGNTTELIVSRKKQSLIKTQLYGRMNIIDIGIALCHLWLAAEIQGKKVQFDSTDGIAPEGYEYVLKATLRP